MRATLVAHSSARSATTSGSHTSVNTTEVLHLAAGDGVAGEQQAAGEHRPEPVEEEVQVAERGSEQPRTGHAELGVAGHDRDVGHQRDLEAAAERVRLDLRDRDLRVRHELVVEGEALAVDAETTTLARPAAVGVVAVPRVRVGHVGAGAEHAVDAAQDHDLDVVVGREVVEVRAHGATHRRVVRVAPVGVVDRDPRDVRLGIAFAMDPRVEFARLPILCSDGRAAQRLNRKSCAFW